jgi:transposase
MRCGFQGLAAKVQTALEENPLGGNVYIFRGRRGDLVKILWATEDGIWLLAKRLERGRFIWPMADGGKVHLSSAQLSMLLGVFVLFVLNLAVFLAFSLKIKVVCGRQFFRRSAP